MEMFQTLQWDPYSSDLWQKTVTNFIFPNGPTAEILLVWKNVCVLDGQSRSKLEEIT